MAEKPKSSGKGITKKVGPVQIWVYPVAGVAAFLLYRFIASRGGSSAGSSSAAPQLSGGDTIPTDTTSSSSPGTGSQFSSLEAWQQAAISAMANGKLSPAAALAGITDWLNGQCVDAAQYTAIGNILETVGLPPGFSTIPTLSVCGGKTTGGKKPPLHGSGYGGGGGNSVRTSDGKWYSMLSPTAYKAWVSAGHKVYFQVEPGVFEQYIPGKTKIAGGTPLYANVRETAAA